MMKWTFVFRNPLPCSLFGLFSAYFRKLDTCLRCSSQSTPYQRRRRGESAFCLGLLTNENSDKGERSMCVWSELTKLDCILVYCEVIGVLYVSVFVCDWPCACLCVSVLCVCVSAVGRIM